MLSPDELRVRYTSQAYSGYTVSLAGIDEFAMGNNADDGDKQAMRVLFDKLAFFKDCNGIRVYLLLA